MKAFTKLFWLIIMALTVVKADGQDATFTNLFFFPPIAFPSSANSTGANPHAGLILISNMFYGTTYDGGSNGYGSIYRVETNGEGFTTLHCFDGTNGGQPQDELIWLNNALYGTCALGGIDNGGTIFKMNLDGSGFVNLVDGGFDAIAHLFLTNNVFYGVSAGGGQFGYGFAFELSTDGGVVTDFFDFVGAGGAAIPQEGLVGDGNGTFYGTSDGGSKSSGLVYKLVGSNIFILHTFTNNEEPNSLLLLSGNQLYGTTPQGGSGFSGSVFRIDTDGSNFMELHGFDGEDDGGSPQKGLILTNGVLYGTGGTVFQINPDGSGFKVLHKFTPFSDGNYPDCYLLPVGNTLYGTTSAGGPGQTGGIFAINLPPAAPTFSIQAITGAVVLSWSDSSYALQSATNLSGVYSTISGAVSPYTNAITASQQFFRLER